MRCIYCKHKKTKVKNTRETNQKTLIWRRRHCPICKKTFTTKEVFLLDNLFVKKRSGKRQRFIYEKLLVSVFFSIEQGKNKDNGKGAQKAKEICEEVIAEIYKLGKKDILTSDILKTVYLKLKKIDPYFAERYKNYSTYRMEVLKKLM